tara:strand:+ start:1806 stop:2942 length:1137 start_codon:yes stop_codon:yes gene_type:complete
MKILIAPDSFKGSLSAKEVSNAIHEGIIAVFPNASIKKIPFSDGGEGAIDLLENFNLGKIENIFTEDSLGKKINASIFWLKKNQIAWIEMSQISGLSGLKKEEQNPMKTSTYGVGVLINHALNKGCKKLYLGLGGSSTHDMGAGIFVALGGELLDKNLSTISKGGGGLLECEKISFANLNPKIKSCEIVLGADVDNPLLGKNGAAKTYSSQKGATPKMIEELELGSKKFAELIQKSTGKKNINVKGGGSAGGVSAGLYGLINAKIENGFNILEKLIDFESYIKNSDLVISGEGHLDNQSKNGKLINKIGFLSKKNRKPLICIAGKVSLKETDYKYLGITKAWASTPSNYPLEKAIKNSYSLIKKKAKVAINHYMKQEE